MKTDFVELVLTCGSWQEAQRIADTLFEQSLINNLEIIEIKDHFGQIGKVKLIIETPAENFDQIETIVTKLSNRHKKLIRS